MFVKIDQRMVSNNIGKINNGETSRLKYWTYTNVIDLNRYFVKRTAFSLKENLKLAQFEETTTDQIEI